MSVFHLHTSTWSTSETPWIIASIPLLGCGMKPFHGGAVFCATLHAVVWIVKLLCVWSSSSLFKKWNYICAERMNPAGIAALPIYYTDSEHRRFLKNACPLRAALAARSETFNWESADLIRSWASGACFRPSTAQASGLRDAEGCFGQVFRVYSDDEAFVPSTTTLQFR